MASWVGGCGPLCFYHLRARLPQKKADALWSGSVSLSFDRKGHVATSIDLAANGARGPNQKCQPPQLER